MGRVSRRIARQLYEEWVERLTGQPITLPAGGPWRITGSSRGRDYEDAPQLWVCNRKKAYPSEDIAHQVAVRLNEANESEETARPGFYGVVVNPYACGRCGAWHLGR